MVRVALGFMNIGMRSSTRVVLLDTNKNSALEAAAL